MSTQDVKGIRETVRDFISSSINLAKFGDDDDLFELGIVNSLFAVQLMTFGLTGVKRSVTLSPDEAPR